jgi:thioredoxin-related protein
MKNYIFSVGTIFCSFLAYAQEPVKKLKRTLPEYVAPPSEAAIKWVTWDEAQMLMQQKPKKIYVDVYTDWCSWCKVMEAKTFSNSNVIRHMNQNFYCIKLNAEKDDNINFGGKVYKLKNGVNELASTLMNNKLSYPTSIFMEEEFKNYQPVPGYLNLLDMEYISTYIATGKNRSMPFETYKQSYKPLWR